ncbi:hypothetical protein HBB16_12885 [Pseudonocardia sp. MCCB 268]|nr:hypothetical protein [Pseudonocardia cytotoxica]
MTGLTASYVTLHGAGFTDPARVPLRPSAAPPRRGRSSPGSASISETSHRAAGSRPCTPSPTTPGSRSPKPRVPERLGLPPAPRRRRLGGRGHARRRRAGMGSVRTSPAASSPPARSTCPGRGGPRHGEYSWPGVTLAVEAFAAGRDRGLSPPRWSWSGAAGRRTSGGDGRRLALVHHRGRHRPARRIDPRRSRAPSSTTVPGPRTTRRSCPRPARPGTCRDGVSCPIHQLVAALRAIGYDGPWSVEVPATPGSRPPDRRGRAARLRRPPPRSCATAQARPDSLLGPVT